MEAVNPKAVKLNTINLEAVDQEACAMEAAGVDESRKTVDVGMMQSSVYAVLSVNS